MHKNKKAYIWISILIFICLLVAINFTKIKFGVNMLGNYMKIGNNGYDELANIDNDIDEEIGPNPLLDIIGNKEGEEENNTNTEDSDNEEEENNNSTASKNDSENSKDNINTNNKDSYIEVISDYNNQFELMEKDYEAKLDSLILIGYKEYQSGEISNTKLANKYINEGTRLEKESDKNFNNLLNEMKKELKSQGHNTDITEDLKVYYKTYKNSTKSKYMRKVKNNL